MTLYDAFLSYRRSDGAPAARWLRRALRGYRLPRDLREGRHHRLNVFLDTFYARGTTDFYEQTIRPALLASRHLVVVATPQAVHSGDDDWIAREIDDFLAHGNPQNIYVARAIGDHGDPIPGDLLQRYPRVQIIDLRGAGTWRAWVPPNAERLRNALLELIAPLHGIAPEQMPSLRAEEVARQRTRIGLGFGLFFAITALSVLVSVNAIQRQAEGQAAVDEGLSASTRIVRTLALGQPEVEDFDREGDEMLLGACVIARRLATNATIPLDPASRLVCEMETALEAAGTLPSPGDVTATETLLDNCIAGARITSGTPNAVDGECAAIPFDRRADAVPGRVRAAVADELGRLGGAARALLKDSATANPEELQLRAQLAYRALRYENRVREIETANAVDAERLLVDEIVEIYLNREANDALNEHNFHVEALVWQNLLIDRLIARLSTGPEADFAITLAAVEAVVSQIAETKAQIDQFPELDALLLISRSGNYEILAHALRDRGAYSAADAMIQRAKEPMQEAIDQFPDHLDNAQWRVWQLDYDDQRLRLMELGETNAAYATLAMETIATARTMAAELPVGTQLAEDLDAGWRSTIQRLHEHHDRARAKSQAEAAEGDFEAAIARLDTLLKETEALYILSDDMRLWPKYYLLILRAERTSYLARSGAEANAEAQRREIYAEMLAVFDPDMPGLSPALHGEFVFTADSVEAAHFAYLNSLDERAVAALDAGKPEQAIEFLQTLRAADRSWDLMRGGLSEFDRVYWAEKGEQLAAALQVSGRDTEADALRLEALRILIPLSHGNDLEGENLGRARTIWRWLSDWANEREINLDTLSPLEEPLVGTDAARP